MSCKKNTTRRLHQWLVLFELIGSISMPGLGRRDLPL
jgi:hypothetical protein